MKTRQSFFVRMIASGVICCLFCLGGCGTAANLRANGQHDPYLEGQANYIHFRNFAEAYNCRDSTRRMIEKTQITQLHLLKVVTRLKIAHPIPIGHFLRYLVLPRPCARL